MAVQYAVWSKLKEMGELKESAIQNLALLLAHLITAQAVSLSIFKV